MDFIDLVGFPMPPSANRLHVNRFGPGKNRRKSDEYRAFERAVALWAIRNRRLVSEAATFTSNIPKDHGLSVDYAFCFPMAKLITKAGHLKRVDVDNRIKPSADALSRVLAFDDSQIVMGGYEKVAIGALTEPFVSFRLRFVPIPRRISWIEQP